MKLAAILPHTFLYGGVKRFIELGRVFIEMGHSFTIYTPAGSPPDWISTAIRIANFDDLKQDQNDVIFVTDRKLKEIILSANARYRIFYHVSRRIKSRIMVRDKRLVIFACSQNVVNHDRLYFRRIPFLAAGGVNTTLFYPKELKDRPAGEPFTILLYGRVSEHIKGTDLIVKACKRLYTKYPFIRLILFDTPVNEAMAKAISEFRSDVPFEFVLNHPVEKNQELFHRADIFVAAEKQTGWANTVAEAMASGIPVVTTRSGTLDLVIDRETGIFVKRNVRSISRGIEELINSYELRLHLASNARKHVMQFDWRILASKIIKWYHEQEPQASFR